MDAVEEATDELYRIAPEDFVAERDARVAAAKENGDKETAKAIGALRRPSRAAWLTNLLVHDRPDEVEGLLGLAETLASAQRTLDGPALRQVSQQRNKLVAALSRRAAQLGREDGHRVDSTLEREVRGVLEAALADPELADRVRSGRLVKAERHAGFGPEPDGDARPRRVEGGEDGRPGTGGRGHGEGGDAAGGDTGRNDSGQGGGGQGGGGQGGGGQGGEDEDDADENTEDAAAREAERRERERREREIAKAEEALEKAEQTARERREEQERRADESVEATERQEKARDRVAELIDELDRARDESAAANKAAHAAAHAEREAARTARTAETARDRAAAALEELKN